MEEDVDESLDVDVVDTVAIDTSVADDKPEENALQEVIVDELQKASK